MVENMRGIECEQVTNERVNIDVKVRMGESVDVSNGVSAHVSAD